MKGPVPRRPRRGRISALLHRLGVWVGIPVLMAGGLYAAVELSLIPVQLGKAEELASDLLGPLLNVLTTKEKP